MLQDRLIAHRGYRRNYPENTMLAYREAIAAGARAIETDVQLSADRQPVLYHDATLSRVSGRRGRVDQRTLAQLLALPAHEPKRFGATFAANRITPLSALVELLAANPGVTAYVEIKREALAFAGIEPCYRIIADCLAPVAAQCVLISFAFDVIAHASAQGWQRNGLVLERWADHRSRAVATIAPEVVFCNHRKVPARADLNPIAPEVVLYEIDCPETAIHWFRRGADKIETFDIGGMIQALARHAL
ncbi:MAG: glycerophosphodiester phosphodiesterase family protein [Porticoccaceae bacterium]